MWVSASVQPSKQANAAQPRPRNPQPKIPKSQLPIIIAQTRTIDKSGHPQQQKKETSVSVSNQALPGGYPVINKKTALDQFLLMPRVANQAPLRRPGRIFDQSPAGPLYQEIKHKSGAKRHPSGHIGACESSFN